MWNGLAFVLIPLLGSLTACHKDHGRVPIMDTGPTEVDAGPTVDRPDAGRSTVAGCSFDPLRRLGRVDGVERQQVQVVATDDHEVIGWRTMGGFELRSLSTVDPALPPTERSISRAVEVAGESWAQVTLLAVGGPRPPTLLMVHCDGRDLRLTALDPASLETLDEERLGVDGLALRRIFSAVEHGDGTVAILSAQHLWVRGADETGFSHYEANVAGGARGMAWNGSTYLTVGPLGHGEWYFNTISETGDRAPDAIARSFGGLSHVTGGVAMVTAPSTGRHAVLMSAYRTPLALLIEGRTATPTELGGSTMDDLGPWARDVVWDGAAYRTLHGQRDEVDGARDLYLAAVGPDGDVTTPPTPFFAGEEDDRAAAMLVRPDGQLVAAWFRDGDVIVTRGRCQP